jgi:outer membrane protein assembly factor BamB
MPSILVALALAAAPGVRTSLPPAPRALYEIAWDRPFVGPQALEWKPIEPGGVALDPSTGIAVFGTRDGWLHAVRPDGSVVWELEARAGFAAPPAIDGDTVYAPGGDGKLYAVALATGKKRWVYDAKEELGTKPVVADGTVYVASMQSTVLAVDARTGAWKWHHRRESHAKFTIRGVAPVAVAGGRVYAAFSDGYVAALDPANGQPAWERLVAPRGDLVDVDGLVLAGDRLYVAAYSGAVMALDARTGDTRWTFATPGASRVALAAGGLVAAVTTSAVYGLSMADGTAVWTTPLRGEPTAAPVMAGKWLVVPAGDAGLLWLDPASGRVIRTFDPGSGVSGPPGVSKGRVYVLTNRGGLFALDIT